LRTLQRVLNGQTNHVSERFPRFRQAAVQVEPIVAAAARSGARGAPYADQAQVDRQPDDDSNDDVDDETAEDGRVAADSRLLQPSR